MTSNPTSNSTSDSTSDTALATSNSTPMSSDATPEPVSGASRHARFRFQFSLRTLLGLTAGCALLSGMIAWRGELGAFQFFFGASICLAALGLVLRRWKLVLVGLLSAAAMYQGVRYSARRTDVTSTSGWLSMSVPLSVVDAKTGEPIAEATVRIEYWGGAEVTGVDGRTEIVCDFSYVISSYDTLFGTRQSAWVDFSGRHLLVEAEGYQPARVSLRDELGSRWDVPGPPLPVITVPMERRR